MELLLTLVYLHILLKLLLLKSQKRDAGLERNIQTSKQVKKQLKVTANLNYISCFSPL